MIKLEKYPYAALPYASEDDRKHQLLSMAVDSPDGTLVLVNLKNFRRSHTYYDEPAILDFEASQVFYSTDLKDPKWSVVMHSKKRLTVQVDDLIVEASIRRIPVDIFR